MPRQTSVMTIIGLTLKELRLNKKITQSSIAKHIGITSAGWGKLENGKASLSVENMMLVCSFLEISPTELLSSIEEQVNKLEESGWDVGIHRVDNDCLLIGKELSAPLTSTANFGPVPFSSLAIAGSAIAGFATANVVSKLSSLYDQKDSAHKKPALGRLVMQLATTYELAEKIQQEQAKTKESTKK